MLHEEISTPQVSQLSQDIVRAAVIPDAAELAKIVARHFTGARARADDNIVETGIEDLCISCRVGDVQTKGSRTAATLHFLLMGSGFRSHQVRMQYVGFGRTAEEAFAAGAATWCHGHAVALKAAAGATGAVPFYDLESRSFTFRVHAGSSQRAFGEAPNIDLVARLHAANQRLGAPGSLTRAAIDSGRLALPRDRWSAVSVMLVEREGSREIDVRLDGIEVPNMDSVFADAAFEERGATVVLHELGIVVPSGPAPRGATVIRRRLN